MNNSFNSDDNSIGSVQEHEIYTYNSQQIKSLPHYPAAERVCSNIGIYFQYKQEFCDWVDTQGYTKDHADRQKKYYGRDFNERTFDTPLELHKYILSKGKDINNIIKSVRGYLNFCEQCDKFSIEIITKYRTILKLKKTRTDFTVPSNEEVIKGYNLVKSHDVLEVVFLVLVTSGIRYIECMDFLRNYDSSKFSIHDTFVSYNVGNVRHTKNINNIYLPMFVYDKIKRIDNSSKALKTRLQEKGCSFSWKYLRKWHYNFMIYNNVPESVADFIQGRSNRSVSSNHYLARSQQADYWYEKIVEKLKYYYRNDI